MLEMWRYHCAVDDELNLNNSNFPHENVHHTFWVWEV